MKKADLEKSFDPIKKKVLTLPFLRSFLNTTDQPPLYYRRSPSLPPPAALMIWLPNSL
jgi:hypothetical protein